jgi:hypothetical protein
LWILKRSIWVKLMFYEKDGMLVHLTLNRPLDDLDENEKREFDESLDDVIEFANEFVRERKQRGK